MSKPESQTAAELLAELNNDPTFVAREQERERLRQEKEAVARQEEAQLITALAKVGVKVQSVWDLVNSAAPYSKALPILLEHLQHPYSPPLREGIARALAVREATFAWSILLQLYRKEDDEQAKDGLAVAIAAIANDDLIEDVIDLTRDLRQGPSRVLLLGALGRSTDPRARSTLMSLGTDPELAKEVQVILRRLKRAKR